MNNLTLLSFDLLKKNDFIHFLKYKKIFFNIMSLSYGSTYWSNEIYEQRINKKNLIISISFYNNIPVGIIIMKKSGKLSALAVIKKYRRQGIATFMVSNIIKEFSYIFVEVAKDNKIMRNLLKKRNFKPINNKEKIYALLYNDEIHILKYKNNPLIYYHGKRYNIDRAKKFILYEFEKLKCNNTLDDE